MDLLIKLSDSPSREMLMKNVEDDLRSLQEMMSSGYESSHVMLTKGRTIFLAEDITDKLASQMSAMLIHFDNESHEDPIEVFIHSNGGDVSGLFNIYDVMQMIAAPIKTICIGKCYSAAAIILAAGTKGFRYGQKNCRIMTHGVQAMFPIPGLDISNSKNYKSFLEENNEMIMKILASHTGQTVDKIRNDCIADTWFSAEMAKNYGIIDHII